MPAANRKTRKRLDVPGHARELTFSTYRRVPLLTDPDAARDLLGATRRACERYGFAVIAFVVMPEHVHLLVAPPAQSGPGRTASPVSSLLYAIKRPVAHRIRARLERDGPSVLERLTVRERPGKVVFRLWQEGGGYDRNITSRESARASADYIHANPVRRGLCTAPGDYPWSSWSQWHEPGRVVAEWMPRVDRGALA